jgi:hypothetical protein
MSLSDDLVCVGGAGEGSCCSDAWAITPQPVVFAWVFGPGSGGVHYQVHWASTPLRATALWPGASHIVQPQEHATVAMADVACVTTCWGQHQQPFTLCDRRTLVIQ